MRVDEFRVLSPEELDIRLGETKEELFNLRFSNATGQLENYKRLGSLKRDVAKINTVLRERQLGIEIEPKELLPEKPRKSRKEEASTEADSEIDVPIAEESEGSDEEEESK
ncbi:MAG: 50S ribosomal protein L29 [Actinobacteria bacterium]|nr:50S ribosomal protein L29 [Actinomycetota bacterium]